MTSVRQGDAIFSESNSEQDYQCGGALHRGPGLLHRVQQVRPQYLVLLGVLEKN